jgi:NADH:ubiquinone oxidoreductase subunit 2 (subunit N)
MFSIAGIPPMIGFLAKAGIFLSVVGISFYLVALISIVFSVVSTFLLYTSD